MTQLLADLRMQNATIVIDLVTWLELVTVKSLSDKTKSFLIETHIGQSREAVIMFDKSGNEEFEQGSEVADLVHIYTVGKGLPSSYKVIMEINKQPSEMELDTGAAVSIIRESTWKQKLLEPPLQPCPFVLEGYPNNKLNILGMRDVEVTAGDTTK